LPGWGYADANADSYRYSDHHTQRDSNVHADSDAKCDSECYANSDTKSNSAAAADPAPSPKAVGDRLKGSPPQAD
jgi:hypothetical protein